MRLWNRFLSSIYKNNLEEDKSNGFSAFAKCNFKLPDPKERNRKKLRKNLANGETECYTA